MRRLFGVFLLVTAASSCGGGNSNNNSTDVPTGPTGPVITETFSGTVDILSASYNTFNVAAAGSQLTINLTAAGPPATIFMGLGLGTFANATCTLLSNATVAAQGGPNVQIGGTVNSGSFCVMVYDIGNQTGTVSYSVVVNHY